MVPGGRLPCHAGASGIACAVLVWPLRGPWPLTRQRLQSVTVWWLAGGLLGAYVFGLGPVAAGLIALLSLPFDEWLDNRNNIT